MYGLLSKPCLAQRIYTRRSCVREVACAGLAAGVLQKPPVHTESSVQNELTEQDRKVEQLNDSWDNAPDTDSSPSTSQPFDTATAVRRSYRKPQPPYSKQHSPPLARKVFERKLARKKQILQQPRDQHKSLQKRQPPGSELQQADLPSTSTEPAPKHEYSNIERAVKATTVVSEIEQIFKKHKGNLKNAELVLLANQLARLSDPAKMTVRVWSQTQVFLQDILNELEPAMPQLNPYECVVLIAAVAKLRHAPNIAWLDTFFKCSMQTLPYCGPGNLTILVRALSRLEMMPWDLKLAPSFSVWIKTYEAITMKKMPAMKTEELVRIIVALSELVHKPDPSWMQMYSATIQRKLDQLDPAALTRVMLAFGTLRYEPESVFMKAYYTQLYTKLPIFDDRDLATTVQAFSMMKRLVKQDFYNEFLDEVLLKLPTFSPHVLSNVVTALAELSLVKVKYVQGPSHQWLETVTMAVRERMWVYSGGNLANVLWGLSILGYHPGDDFLHEYVTATFSKLHTMRTTELIRALQGLGTFKYRAKPETKMFSKWFKEYRKLAVKRLYNCTQASNMLAALAAIGQHPDNELIGVLLHACRLTNMKNISATRLVQIGTSLRQLKYMPDFGFMHNFSQAARFLWNAFRPQEYAELLLAIGYFGMAPVSIDPLWAPEFLAIIQCKIPEFRPQPLATLLKAMTMLPGLRPSPQWLCMVIMRCQELHAEFSGPQMCDVICSLGDLGFRPSAAALQCFVSRIDDTSTELTAEQQERVAAALTQLVMGYLPVTPAAAAAGAGEQLPPGVWAGRAPEQAGASPSTETTGAAASAGAAPGQQQQRRWGERRPATWGRQLQKRKWAAQKRLKEVGRQVLQHLGEGCMGSGASAGPRNAPAAASATAMPPPTTNGHALQNNYGNGNGNGNGKSTSLPASNVGINSNAAIADGKPGAFTVA